MFCAWDVFRAGRLVMGRSESGTFREQDVSRAGRFVCAPYQQHIEGGGYRELHSTSCFCNVVIQISVALTSYHIYNSCLL